MEEYSDHEILLEAELRGLIEDDLTIGDFSDKEILDEAIRRGLDEDIFDGVNIDYILKNFFIDANSIGIVRAMEAFICELGIEANIENAFRIAKRISADDRPGP